MFVPTTLVTPVRGTRTPSENLTLTRHHPMYIEVEVFYSSLARGVTNVVEGTGCRCILINHNEVATNRERPKNRQVVELLTS